MLSHPHKHMSFQANDTYFHQTDESSMVKEVCRLDGDISAFVPKEILDDIIARCKGER